MATFSQIFVNVIVGLVVFLVSVALFEGAVRWECNSRLAPRTWSRPRAVLKNVLQSGNYFYEWYTWGLTVSYPTLLEGISGTGTRNNGWKGPKLKTNLDGVIMMKFHTLLMKVSLLAAILCMFIIFPVNYTAECDPGTLGWGTCIQLWNLTNGFDQSTIAHLPPYEFNPVNTIPPSADAPIIPPFIPDDWILVASGITTQYYVPTAGLGPRYFAIVLVAFVIYGFTCVLVRQEWIENVALRRVYYLEHDHYQERLQELDDTACIRQHEEDAPFQNATSTQQKLPPWLPHPELRETVPNIALYSALYKLPYRFATTIGLPTTNSDGNNENATTTTTTVGLERQLAATVQFFEECVEKQPGYSSSVAAVTILPEARFVVPTWKKWVAAAIRLRRLRYIRSILQAKLDAEEAEAEEVVFVNEKREENEIVEDVSSSNGHNRIPSEAPATIKDDTNSQQQDSVAVQNMSPQDTTTNKSKPQRSSLPKPQASDDTTVDTISDKAEKHNLAGESAVPEEEDDRYMEPSTVVSFGGTISLEDENDDGKVVSEPKAAQSQVTPVESIEEETSRNNPTNSSSPKDEEVFSYRNFDSGECARLLGMMENSEEIDAHLLSGLGVEQLSVYAREFAQNSSNPCPFGCAPDRIKSWDVKQLRLEEAAAMEALEEAKQDLIEAQTIVLNKLSATATYTAHSDSSDGEEDGPDLEQGIVLSPSAESSTREHDGLRKRSVSNSASRWKEAKDMAERIGEHPGSSRRTYKSSGTASTKETLSDDAGNRRRKPNANSDRTRVESVLDHPTYAVVTFTSRQAAVAARQCMMAGGGLDRWNKIDELPITPLADAPPRNILFCRACCSPVTLSISDNEKQCRTYSTNIFFVLLSLLYTLPLALTSQLLSPESLKEWFPNAAGFWNTESVFFRSLAGFYSGLLYTLFFSLCPLLFKAMATFKGNASNFAVAEDSALRYYWIFMLLTAFTGSSLANMVIKIIQGVGAGDAIRDVFREVGLAIPTQQAPVWLNWIIVRFTYTLPVLYLFQANTFIFSILRFRWLSRMMRGGGPGGPPPYRIYIDSGTVFLCAVALGPACPTVAPFAFLYFCVMNPMLRWMHIFVYRPKYDGGGSKWPMLHDIIISTLIVSQVLLAIMLFLKYAYWAASAVMLVTFPTYAFGARMKRSFLHQFRDAGVFQTRCLDDKLAASITTREEYIRWLVDCHKASYVPVCLASSDSMLTAAPCIAMPTHQDL